MGAGEGRDCSGGSGLNWEGIGQGLYPRMKGRGHGEKGGEYWGA